MLAIHPNARTTPAVRAEIARLLGAPACWPSATASPPRPSASGASAALTDCQDRSARPHKLPWKASEEERAIVCALRRSTGFPLDDLTFVVTHFLPHLNRDAVYRILKAEGLNRLPPADRSRKPHGTFKEYELGFVHLDVKHLPKLRDRDGVTRKRFLYVAIDRCSRWVHLAVKDDETTASRRRLPEGGDPRPSPSRSRTCSPTGAPACHSACGSRHRCPAAWAGVSHPGARSRP